MQTQTFDLRLPEREFPTFIFVLQSNLHGQDDLKLQCYYWHHELVSVYSQSTGQSNTVVYSQRLRVTSEGMFYANGPVDCMRELQLASDDLPVRKLSKLPAFLSISD